MRFHSKTRFFSGIVLMLVMMGLLAACGDPTATTAPTTAAATTTAAPKPTTAAAATTASATTASATTTAAAATTTASAATTAANTGTDNPLVIGMINSKTGALSIYGKMIEDSWAPAIEYYTKGTGKIGGRTVKLVVEDDAGDANKAVEAARKLVQQDKAEVLVGIASSASAIAVSGVNDKELKKVMIIDPAADISLTGTNFSKYAFRTGRNNDQDAAVGAAYAAEVASKKNKKIVHIYQDYAFGQGANTAWKEVATKTPGIQWTEIPVPTSATDFTPYVQKILDAAPDVTVLNWAGTTGPKLLTQMKDADVFSKTQFISPIGDQKATIKAFGDVIQGAYGVGIYFYQFPKNAENDFLVKYYKEKYNTYPDIFDTAGFNIVGALTASLAKTNGSTDPDKLIPALEGLTFNSVKGTMTIRAEDHQALQPMYLVKMDKDPTGAITGPVPTLIKEYTAQESAPPVRVKK